MLSIFRGTGSNHPMADLKEARRVLGALPLSDAFASLEEISHWLVSIQAESTFRPDHRGQLVQMLDEAGQGAARKLTREYLANPRLGKHQETKLWNTIHDFWRNVALGYVTVLDAFATGAKGGDALKGSLPLLGVRTIRAFASQLKWLHVRYGPLDARIWTTMCRIYALLQARNAARVSVIVYPGAPVGTTAEQEFLRVAMFSACSPASLLPLEIEIAERVIAHCSRGFLFLPQHQEDTPYWIDIALGEAPVRVARPPQPSSSVLFFGAGQAVGEIEALVGQMRSTGSVPSALGFADSYPGEAVRSVLEHLEQCWSPKGPVRRHPRHRVKSRLTIAWGFDGILGVLDVSEAMTSLDFAGTAYESWIVDNVSVGGFGALVPQVRGDWLRIGCLVGMRPEGGDKWLVGVIRRLSRPSLDQAAVGIQTLARAAFPVALHVHAGNLTSLDTEQGILLNHLHTDSDVQLLVRPGVHAPGQSFTLDWEGRRVVLLPAGIAERGHDYELIRCRHFVRDTA
jgi:hypothetical protein